MLTTLTFICTRTGKKCFTPLSHEITGTWPNESIYISRNTFFFFRNWERVFKNWDFLQHRIISLKIFIILQFHFIKSVGSKGWLANLKMKKNCLMLMFHDFFITSLAAFFLFFFFFNFISKRVYVYFSLSWYTSKIWIYRYQMLIRFFTTLKVKMQVLFPVSFLVSEIFF